MINQLYFTFNTGIDYKLYFCVSVLENTFDKITFQISLIELQFVWCLVKVRRLAVELDFSDSVERMLELLRYLMMKTHCEL